MSSVIIELDSMSEAWPVRVAPQEFVLASFSFFYQSLATAVFYFFYSSSTSSFLPPTNPSGYVLIFSVAFNLFQF
jgi:hypothetical protein